MIRVLQSSWLAALVGCLAYLGSMLMFVHPEKLHIARKASAEEKSAAVDEPSWKFANPEFDQWVQEIKHQREAITLREQQLQELQTRLETERQELNVATQTVAQLQSEFDKNVIRIKDQEAGNIRRQSKVIAGMSPDAAASLIAEMPQDDAVRILVTMKTDEAGAILETMSKAGKPEAKAAALLTEKMRHALPPDTAAPAKPSS